MAVVILSEMSRRPESAKAKNLATAFMQRPFHFGSSNAHDGAGEGFSAVRCTAFSATGGSANGGRRNSPKAFGVHQIPAALLTVGLGTGKQVVDHGTYDALPVAALDARVQQAVIVQGGGAIAPTLTANAAGWGAPGPPWLWGQVVVRERLRKDGAT